MASLDLTAIGNRVVILSPHDDDAVLGVGGLIQQLISNKSEVLVAVLTDGALGYPTAELKEGIVERRRKEAAACYDMIGATIERLDLPDMGLHPYRCWTTQDGKAGAYQLIVQLLRDFKADAVFIPNPIDRHPDHQAAYDIGRVGVFQASSPVAADLGEPIKLTSVFSYAVWDALPEVSHIYPVTEEEMEKKRASIEAYESQAEAIKLLEISDQEHFLRLFPSE